MKKIFIETKYKGKIDLPKELIEELPQKIVVCSTVQFSNQLNEIKSKLVAYKKTVYLFSSVHGRHVGQILGCDRFKVMGEIDGFLYIGDGKFHPKALLVNEKPVFCYNPFSNKWDRLGRKEWEEIKLKKKIALMKFHSSTKIGIIVSTKEKQNNIQGPIEKLKEKLESDGKEVYLFLCDEVKDLENFNFIECWINTACPRISDDFEGMLNLKDIV